MNCRGSAAVSIPSGFSTLLRPSFGFLTGMPVPCFNPFRVFYPAATTHAVRNRAGVNRFNPFRVFYPAATLRNCWGELSESFQSLPGFLPCCDVDQRREPLGLGHVSIPSGFSTLLRPFNSRILLIIHGPFQSLPGFLPCCDTIQVTGDNTDGMFQSLPGFLPCCDTTEAMRDCIYSSFNPFRVFYPAATGSRWRD